MKKLKNSKKKFLLKRQKRIEMERSARKIRKHTRFISKSFKQKHSVFMPRIISIYMDEHRKELLLSLERLRKIIAEGDNTVIVDFSLTRHAFADGMIVVYAEIDRIVNSEKHANKIIVCPPTPYKTALTDKDWTNSEKIRQLLEHVGLLRLGGRTKNEIKPQREDVVNWIVAKGIKSEGQKADEILDVVEEKFGQRVAKKFYTGITEAMTNSYHHAYTECRHDGLGIDEKGWWLFMYLSDESLSIIVCDLGIGIPRSLPINYGYAVYKIIESFGLKYTDSAAIHFAAGAGNTSTALSHRGKGLRKMVDIAHNVKGSSLSIFSNYGHLSASKESQNILKRLFGDAELPERNSKDWWEFERIEKDYSDSIMGTVINWSVSLKEVI